MSKSIIDRMLDDMDDEKLFVGVHKVDLDGMTDEDLKATNDDIKKRKFKECKHKNTKQGCCDFCGKDMIGE